MEFHWKSLLVVTIFVFALHLHYSEASSLYNDKSQAELSEPDEQERGDQSINQLELLRNVRRGDLTADDVTDIEETTQANQEKAYEKGQEGRGLSESGKPDNAIDDFLMHVFNFGVKHTLENLNKIGLPQIDPLKLPDFNLEKDLKVATAKGSATGMAVVGLGGLGLKNLKTDLDKLAIHFEFGVPSVSVVGNYKIAATLFKYIKINGGGALNIGIEDLYFSLGGSINLKDPITLKLDLCKITVKSKKGAFDKLTGNAGFQEKLNEILGLLTAKIVEMIEPTICKLFKSALETFVSKELEGIKVPPSLLKLFDGFKSLVSSMTGRKKRSISSVEHVENFSKIALIPFLIPENRR